MQKINFAKNATYDGLALTPRIGHHNNNDQPKTKQQTTHLNIHLPDCSYNGTNYANTILTTPFTTVHRYPFA